MAEVALGIDHVAHQLLQLGGVGKAAVALAVPDQLSLQVMVKMPPVPGTSTTSPRSVPKVDSSSCAIQPARSSHWHCVQ